MSRTLSSVTKLLCVVAIAGSMALVSSPARADTTYGINVGGALPILGGAEDRTKGFLSNPVVEGWVGYEFPLPILLVAAEVKLGMTSLRPRVESRSTSNEDIYRASVGARLGMSALLSPQVFAHMGWGWLSGTSDVVVVGNRGMTYELGAALDFDALPFVRAGIYASVNRLFHQREESGESSNTHWIAYGLQGTILW